MGSDHRGWPPRHPWWYPFWLQPPPHHYPPKPGRAGASRDWTSRPPQLCLGLLLSLPPALPSQLAPGAAPLQPCPTHLLPASSSTLAPLSPLPRSSRTTSWMMRAPMKAYSSACRGVASGRAWAERKTSTQASRRRGPGCPWGWGRLEGGGSGAGGPSGAPPQGTLRSEGPWGPGQPQTSWHQGRLLRSLRRLKSALPQKPTILPGPGEGAWNQRLTLLRLGRRPTPNVTGAVGDEAETGTGESALLPRSPGKTTRTGPPGRTPQGPHLPGRPLQDRTLQGRPPARHPHALTPCWHSTSGDSPQAERTGSQCLQTDGQWPFILGEGLCKGGHCRRVWGTGAPDWPCKGGRWCCWPEPRPPGKWAWIGLVTAGGQRSWCPARL